MHAYFAPPTYLLYSPHLLSLKASRFESRYLVYAEMIKTTQVYA